MNCQGFRMNWFTIDPMEFRIWLTEKYIEWRGDKIGHSGSVTAFAEHVGASQPQMSAWMNGDYAPAKANLDKLADKLGYEVYDILDIPQDERSVRSDIRRIIHQVPLEHLDDLKMLIEDFLSQINGNSPCVLCGKNHNKERSLSVQ